MIIDSLQIEHFRNLRSVRIAPDPRFNLIVGENGQGKTNLIECVSMLATLRSFRSLRNRDLIERAAEQAKIEAHVIRGEQRRDVSITIRSNGRRVALNNNPLRELGLFFGQVNTVVFSPEDVSVFRAGPAERRLFFDRIIFNLTPAYAQEMSDYEDALRQRNAILKNERVDRALLAAWNEPVARLAATIVQRRWALLQRIREPFLASFGDIFDARLPVDIQYECSFAPATAFHDRQQLQQCMIDALAEAQSRDMARGYTTVGPHRDDFPGIIEGEALRTWGSQGQHRAFVLALKTTEITLLTQNLGFAPILLLDDVSSELDPLRNERLFQFLSGFDGQVFITTTDASFIRIDHPAQHWNVENGVVRAP